MRRCRRRRRQPPTVSQIFFNMLPLATIFLPSRTPLRACCPGLGGARENILQMNVSIAGRFVSTSEGLEPRGLWSGMGVGNSFGRSFARCIDGDRSFEYREDESFHERR